MGTIGTELSTIGQAKISLNKILSTDKLIPELIQEDELAKEFLTINTLLRPLDRKIGITADMAYTDE